MRQFLSAVTLLVSSYEEGLAFYVGKLGFRLVEDTPLSDDKRWVVVAPPGAEEAGLLLARAASDDQRAAIGAQAGGRVFLFLRTDDFGRDYRRYLEAGVAFEEAAREEPYGAVAVFADPFGNRWDLIGSKG
jgi:catechol 2,3-dioxygenase-like lactoylglutathione lyase family enzyme